jgi:hypothetical protein
LQQELEPKITTCHPESADKLHNFDPCTFLASLLISMADAENGESRGLPNFAHIPSKTCFG